MDGARRAVAEHLDLDVARRVEIFLEVHRVVAERRLGLGARGCERRRELRLATRDLHAAPAAAGRRLHQHRKADPRRAVERLRLGDPTRAVRARHDRNAEALRGALGGDLVAHQADVLGPGADEMHAVLDQDFGEAGVFGRESRSPDAPRRRR